MMFPPSNRSISSTSLVSSPGINEEIQQQLEPVPIVNPSGFTFLQRQEQEQQQQQLYQQHRQQQQQQQLYQQQQQQQQQQQHQHTPHMNFPNNAAVDAISNVLNRTDSITGGIDIGSCSFQEQEQESMFNFRNQLFANALYQRPSVKANFDSSSSGLETLRRSSLSHQLEQQRQQQGQGQANSNHGFTTSAPEGAGAVQDCSSVRSEEHTISSTNSNNPSYTLHQAGRWQQRFSEILDFKKEHGHCCVPSHWPRNSALAQWVKRQRSQWRLKMEGRRSNMTEGRERALTNMGFIWDSHSVLWEERLNELKEFVRKHGHANVPTRHYENPQLASWCKCQRRQFKLLTLGDARSNITMERASKLSDVGFIFNPRKLKENNNHHGTL